MSELWTEKYRPTNIDQYVFRDESQRNQIKQWIKNKSIPNLLLSGTQGVGKSALALMLMKELQVVPADIKIINASKNNGVDYIRDTLDSFCSVMPHGDYRYIILDEADYLSSNAQACLRNPMDFDTETVRFILTCNYPHKIMPAIHSRCQQLHIEEMDTVEFTLKMANILVAENVAFTLPDLDKVIANTYPDMRKCINNCSLYSTSGTLVVPENSTAEVPDYMVSMLSLFREKKYKEAREVICKQIPIDAYDGIYRFMYDNIDLWADDDNKVRRAIRVIKQGLVDDGCIADREICLSATLASLEMISNNEQF